MEQFRKLKQTAIVLAIGGLLGGHLLIAQAADGTAGIAGTNNGATGGAGGAGGLGATLGAASADGGNGGNAGQPGQTSIDNFGGNPRAVGGAAGTSPNGNGADGESTFNLGGGRKSKRN